MKNLENRIEFIESRIVALRSYIMLKCEQMEFPEDEIMIELADRIKELKQINKEVM